LSINLISADDLNENRADEPKETSKEFNKFIEFSIGGTIDHLYSLGIYYIDYYFYDNVIDILNNHAFLTLLPINFTYFFKNNFGFGFLNNLGMKLLLQGGYYPLPFLVEQSKISFKYGKNFKKLFVYEAGISIKIFLFNGTSIFGPNFYFEYETEINQSLMFSIGSIFEYLMHTRIMVFTGIYGNTYTEIVEYTGYLNVGIEVKLSYYTDFFIVKR